MSRDRTHAFYRRWLIIPFERIFEGENADKDLRAKLRDELPGIMNRALNGLKRLLSERRFSETQGVKSALKEYQRQNDTVASFVTECVVEDPNGSIPKQVFYKAYRIWCEDQGLRPVSQSKLKASLEQFFTGLDEITSSGGSGPWHWVGIILTEDARESAG